MPSAYPHVCSDRSGGGDERERSEKRRGLGSEGAEERGVGKGIERKTRKNY